VVTSPHPTVDAGVVFPERALRDRIANPVDVDLDLVVDAEGQVTRATVVTPRGTDSTKPRLPQPRKYNSSRRRAMGAR
jgi:hypothetical protein